MNNDWKVPTLEQCKKLVELGVELETEKVWVDGHLATRKETAYCTMFDTGQSQFPYEIEMTLIPAPDVAELGKILPAHCLDIDTGPAYIEMSYFKGKNGEWYWGYEQNYFQDSDEYFESLPFETEAQARCAALTWLIESKTCVWNQEIQQLRAV